MNNPNADFDNLVETQAQIQQAFGRQGLEYTVSGPDAAEAAARHSEEFYATTIHHVIERLVDVIPPANLIDKGPLVWKETIWQKLMLQGGNAQQTYPHEKSVGRGWIVTGGDPGAMNGYGDGYPGKAGLAMSDQGLFYVHYQEKPDDGIIWVKAKAARPDAAKLELDLATKIARAHNR